MNLQIGILLFLFPTLVYASIVFNEVCHVGVSLQHEVARKTLFFLQVISIALNPKFLTRKRLLKHIEANMTDLINAYIQ